MGSAAPAPVGRQSRGVQRGDLQAPLRDPMIAGAPDYAGNPEGQAPSCAGARARMSTGDGRHLRLTIGRVQSSALQCVST